jgi:hypothetical protein
MEDRSYRRMRTLVTRMAQCALIFHDGPEHNTLQSEAGYIGARPHIRRIDETNARPDSSENSEEFRLARNKPSQPRV